MTRMAPPPEQSAPTPGTDEESESVAADPETDQDTDADPAARSATDRNTGHLTPPDRQTAAAREPATERTTVDVRAVGKLRHELDEDRFEFTFQGDTLREFVGAILAAHPGLEAHLVGETRREDDGGWTDLRDDDEGRTRPYVRAMVNGTFNEFIDGADTELAAGDEVELVYPLCC